jgi:plasmid stabilization system protein ParE
VIVRVRLNVEAVTDLDEIVTYLGGKGAEFENRLGSTLDGLREMPGKGRPLVSVVNYPLAPELQSIHGRSLPKLRDLLPR